MKLKIEHLGRFGDGIAKGPVIVPLALPGEEVEGEIVSGRMAAPRILTPSPNRVRPPCSHFKSCGGCQMQHVNDETIGEWKRQILRNALDAQGLTADILPMQVSAPRTRRRASLSARRSKKGVIIGFHARASGVIIPISDCHLLHPDLVATLPALGELTRAGATRRQEMTFAITRTLQGTDVSASGGRALEQDLRAELAALAARHGLARLVWDDDLVAELTKPFLRFGRTLVAPPPGVFLQATEEGERALVLAVSETVSGCEKIADLFSGCGTFSLPLAERASVHAVEQDAEMLKALDSGWRQLPGLKHVSTEARDLFRRPLLPDELAGFDAVVIDPPRAGAEAQTKILARSRVPVIAAVSCNPVTFARDARILVDAGYHLDQIRPVDQFRWSPHLELTARFTLS